MNGKRRVFSWPVAAALAALFLTFMVSSAAAKLAGSERKSDRTPIYTTGGFTFTDTDPGPGFGQYLSRPPDALFVEQDGEPEIKTDLFGNTYVTAIRGVPGGVDLWKSTDKGASFQYLGQPDGAQQVCGSPTPSCLAAGGGDDSIDVSTGGYLYVSSLWLGNTTMSTSMDGGTGGALPGQAWIVNPASGGVPVEDREWIAAYGPRTVYMIWRQAPGIGVLFFTKSTDAGRTWSVPSMPFGTTAVAARTGNLVVDPYNGNLYSAFVANGAGDQVKVMKSTNAGSTWTQVVAYDGPAGTDTGNAFPIMAVDRGGNIHVAFSRCNTGVQRFSCHVYLTSSADQGVSWTDVVRVDNGNENNTALMPWIVAGSPGIVDITWYGTSATSPDVASDWQLFFAQTRDAMVASPTIRQVQVSTNPVHDLPICSAGGGCTGNTRHLLEYYSMTIDPDGNANIAYMDGIHNCPNGGCFSTTWFTKQATGQSAYAPPGPPAPATFSLNKNPGTNTGAEPNIWIDSDNCIYLAAIGSNAPGGLPVYKSNDMGNTFSLKPVTGPILVGDADVITFPDGNPTNNDDVYLSSLEIVDVSIMKSANGDSFAPVPAPGNVSNPSSDRMWFAADKFGADQVLYQVDHELVSEDIRVFKSVNDGAWTGTSAITDPEFLLRTTPNTNTGNIWVDKTNHNVYATFPSSTNTTNAMDPPFGKQLEVWVVVSTGNTNATNAGTTWGPTGGGNFPVLLSVIDSPTTPAPPPGAETFGVKAGNIFSAGDVDSAGNNYITWAMNNSRTNQFQIWFSASRDQGQTWYGPHLVSQGIGTSVMPWIAAGDNGRISIAWYGTSAVGDPNTIPNGTQWHVYFAQSLNAASREPVFAQVEASDHVMHLGQISTGGLVGSADRSLLDFFEVALDRGGFTHMVFADNGPTPPTGTVLSYIKQTGGPRAYTSPTFPSCPGGPTAVGLASFRAAHAGAKGVRVVWQTATELQTAGFNVWRSAGKGYRKVNAKLIPSQSSFGVGGHKYEYLDRGALARGAYSYKLELVKLDGSRRWAGPVRAAARARSGAR